MLSVNDQWAVGSSPREIGTLVFQLNLKLLSHGVKAEQSVPPA